MTTTTFRGKPCCPCLAAWLPAYEAELLRRKVIARSIDIYQLNGNAPASAGTHKGGAFDIAQTSTTALLVAREMGAPATWRRTKAQGFTLHTHGVLRGCPHNAAARYQINAVDAGYNGLGRGGRGGHDDGPKVTTRRTWQQGIAWAAAQAPAVLPPRVLKTRAQLLRDIDETTTEIKRTKAARKVAASRREPLQVHNDTIAALSRIRTEQRKAYALLGTVTKRRTA